MINEPIPGFFEKRYTCTRVIYEAYSGTENLTSDILVFKFYEGVHCAHHSFFSESISFKGIYSFWSFGITEL